MMPCVNAHTHARHASGRAALPRGLHATLAIAAATALCGWGGAAVGTAASFPTHVCGNFFRSGQDFIVYNSGGVSCRQATKLIKGFVLGNPIQHGTSDAGSYWTINGEPGFRCVQAMDEGQCYKGKETAAYRIKA
jgi:hypothetical protein